MQSIAQEKKLLPSRENEEFGKQVGNSFIRSVDKKTGKRTTRNRPESIDQDPTTRTHTSDGKMKKANLPDNSSSIRREKVEEARKKQQNGDYDNQEVYQKIAERLMDLFGI